MLSSSNSICKELAFCRVEPKETGRPGYHPADLLKLYIYGYLNRVRSSRRLEAETRRNLEVMWLLRGLTPDFKTIADSLRVAGVRELCPDTAKIYQLKRTRHQMAANLLCKAAPCVPQQQSLRVVPPNPPTWHSARPASRFSLIFRPRLGH